MPEAARPTDPTAHGDPLSPGPGSDNVTSAGKKQWRAGPDSHLCKHPVSDAAEICKLGSLTVHVNGKMAVRKDDFLTGAGAPNTIAKGAATVLIGDIRMGLWDPANAAEFCKDMCDLKKKWDKMTPAERRAALDKAVNKQLAKSGVPHVGINPKALGGSTWGQLDFQSWNLDINQNLLNKATLTDADMSNLGNTVYHEARHGEQWYGMAQSQAGSFGSGGALASNMGIPQSVGNSAFANPAAAGSYTSGFGNTMYQSVYGPDGGYRNGVLTSLGNTPPPPNGYQQYRALPEERDAWRTGDTMGSCKCK